MEGIISSSVAAGALLAIPFLLEPPFLENLLIFSLNYSPAAKTSITSSILKRNSGFSSSIKGIRAAKIKLPFSESFVLEGTYCFHVVSVFT